MITSDLTTDSSNPVERALEEFRKKVLEPYGTTENRLTKTDVI